jgi:hypothetical protein
MTNKSDKFIHLANKRVRRAIKAMQLIANLSNSNNYDYKDEQVTKIINALKKEVSNIQGAFNSTNGSSKDEFTL